MSTDVNISGWQICALIIGFLFGSSTLLIPSAAAGRDLWMSVLIAGTLSFFQALLLIRVARKFPKKLPTEMFLESMGRCAGTVFSILFIWFCFHLGSLVVKNVSEAYFATIFQRTPEEVVDFGFTALSIIAAYLGLEVIARTGEAIVPLLLFSVGVIILLSAMTTDLLEVENILPMFEKGFLPILKGALAVFGFPFGEIVVFLSVLPFVNQKDEPTLKGWVLGAILVGMLFIAGIEIRNVMALGATKTKMFFPSLATVSLVSLGQFIQRLDAVLLFVWTFGAYIKIAVCLYAAVANLTTLLKMVDTRFLAFPVGSMMATLSTYVYRNTADMVDFISYAWAIYALPFEVLIPLILYLLSRPEKTRGK